MTSPPLPWPERLWKNKLQRSNSHRDFFYGLVRLHSASLVQFWLSVMEVVMPQSAIMILHQALALPSNDRAALVEGLITSLDKPDPVLDAMWLKEAKDRMAAYRAGELDAIDAKLVFADIGKKI